MIRQHFQNDSTTGPAVNPQQVGPLADDATTLVMLSRVRAGQRARIASVEGSCAEISRLAEMGLRRGVEVTALRGGTTSILKVNRSQLCLRLGKETKVRVQPIE